MPKRGPKRYVLAVDLGSSRIRCVAFTLKGRAKAAVVEEWAAATPSDVAPLGREYPARATWALVARLIRECAEQVEGEIVGISATGQREAIALLDGNGRELYVGPNTDLRAFFEGQALDAQGEELYRSTGHQPAFMFAAAKLRWFKANRPELYARIASVLSLDAWVAYRLCGELAISPASAGESGLLGLDRTVGQSLERVGVNKSWLPALHEAGSSLGRITRATAQVTGLQPGTKVSVGGPDTQSALLGMGVVEPRAVGVVGGWSTPVQMVTERPLLDKAGRTWTGLHLLPERYVVEGNTTESGGAYTWLAEVLGEGGAEMHGRIDQLAAKQPPGANGAVAFLGPRQGDMQDVGPRWGGLLFPVPFAAGRIERGQLYRAAFENLAYAVRANLEVLQDVTRMLPAQIAWGGGMAGSRALSQILADVLGRGLRRHARTEVAALGAAMAAATGSGQYEKLRQAVLAMRSSGEAVPADPERTLEYQEHYMRWRNLGEALRGLGGLL